MYIHIGEDHMVRAKDIVAIIDRESAGAGGFLEPGKSLNLSKGPFKSVVITEEKIFLSPLASGTLKKTFSPLGH